MSYFGSIYRDNELTSRASNVYRYLADRANSDGQCWPSERTIAQDLKISKSTVKRAIEDLKRCGFGRAEIPQKRRKQFAVVCAEGFF